MKPADMDAGPLEEERDFLLRSLRDLEAEHDAGDIDDVDYRSLKDDYTVRAASVLRQLAGEPDEPEPEDAEPDRPEEVEAEPPPPAAEAPRKRRRWLVTAAAALVIGVGAGIAVVHASGTRGSGETITGDATPAEKIQLLLSKAQQEAASGHAVDALKDCQSVLAEDPGQPQAPAEAGWLLAQTQRPDLEQQGLADLQQAVTTDPADSTAHLYRGIVLLQLGRQAEAVPDLQWYLAHDPDPAVKARVAQQLAQAQAAKPTSPSTAPAQNR